MIFLCLIVKLAKVSLKLYIRILKNAQRVVPRKPLSVLCRINLLKIILTT